MPIDNATPRFRELGRLKFGEDLGDRPGQLRTWRLTSSNPDLIGAASVLWGGEVVSTFEGPAEVVTEASALDVLLPSQDLAAGQWFELWAAGGLQRRCTGSATVDVDHSGAYTETGPCQCEPTRRECRLRTVLRVLLPQLPDLGVWRLSTGSTYAAAELPPAVEAITALNAGQLAPAVLGLEERTQKRPGEKPHHYIVPVLRTRSTLAELIAGGPDPAVAAGALPPSVAGELEAGGRPSTHRAPTADPLPAQNPLSGPESPQIGEFPPDRAPDTQNDGPERWEPFESLARFLTETDAGDQAATFDELLASLDELEALMVAAGLWKPGAIDASAQKAGLPESWRAGTLTADVRRLAVRANIAATRALDEHPEGFAAIQRAKRAQP